MQKTKNVIQCRMILRILKFRNIKFLKLYFVLHKCYESKFCLAINFTWKANKLFDISFQSRYKKYRIQLLIFYFSFVLTNKNMTHFKWWRIRVRRRKCKKRTNEQTDEKKEKHKLCNKNSAENRLCFSLQLQ